MLHVLIAFSAFVPYIGRLPRVWKRSYTFTRDDVTKTYIQVNNTWFVADDVSLLSETDAEDSF